MAAFCLALAVAAANALGLAPFVGPSLAVLAGIVLTVAVILLRVAVGPIKRPAGWWLAFMLFESAVAGTSFYLKAMFSALVALLLIVLFYHLWERDR